MFLLQLLLICVATSCTKTRPKPYSSESPVLSAKNDLPHMIMTAMDGSAVNIHDLKGNIIIVMFQPDCDHCQREAKEIQEHLKAFEKYTIYFITSPYPKHDIEKFGKDYNLSGHPNIILGQTSTDEILKNFGPIPTPSVYIYSNNVLVQKFNGETEIEKILLAI